MTHVKPFATNLKFQAIQINKVWHVVNLLTDEAIEIVWREKAEQLAIRLNIRHLANYASIGEFEWRLLVSGSRYVHAIMPYQNDHFNSRLSLCDKQKRGLVGFNSPLVKCPDCISVIKTMNEGFVPSCDPHCLKWQQGKIDLATLYIQMNNEDYADFLAAGV